MNVIRARGVPRGNGCRCRRRFLVSSRFLGLDSIEPDQIEGDGFEDGKIVRGLSGAGAHQVFVERHIQDPVQPVLECPRWSRGSA